MEMGPATRYTLWRNTASKDDLIFLLQGWTSGVVHNEAVAISLLTSVTS